MFSHTVRRGGSKFMEKTTCVGVQKINRS